VWKVRGCEEQICVVGEGIAFAAEAYGDENYDEGDYRDCC